VIRKLSLIVLFLALAFGMAVAQTVAVDVPVTSAPAKSAAGGVVAVVIEVLSKLSFIMPILLAFGAGWKFLPGIKNVVNESVIPILNAVLAFLIGFGGGTQAVHAMLGIGTAYAGIFGDLGKVLSIPAQLMASVLISGLTAWVHDKFLKGVTPKSPYTLKKEAEGGYSRP